MLVDTDRRFADTYGLINVPTVIWLDAERRVVRDPSPEFSDDTFTEVHGVESGPHLDARPPVGHHRGRRRRRRARRSVPAAL